MAADKLIVLISGANQGIGYYGAQQFAATGKYHVLLGSRDLSKGQKAIKDIIADSKLSVKETDIEAIQLDITSDDSIAAAVKTVQSTHGRLDILINNAGINHPTEPSLRAAYDATFNTNTTSHAITTTLFLPLLQKSTLPGGKRIIFTSSGLGSLAIASNTQGPFPANIFPVYRASKTALNMVMLHYAVTLGAEEGFVVSGVCPGFCGTNLNGYSGTTPPAEGAEIFMKVVEGTREEVHAKVVHAKGVYEW